MSGQGGATVDHRSADGLKHLETLFDSGTLGELGDDALLGRFAARREEGAFAVLVERHGPMVLGVCQHVLGDPHDAQDAFQAVFLILARRAGSIRRAGSVASWLHGVALRVAAKAKVAAARRRVHERRGGEMTARRIVGEGLSDAEGWPEVHEELGRLPEKYRSPLVLCYLEGLTQEAAARRLDWPLGTLQSRLARGRERLRARLTRRGVAAPAVLLAAAGSGTSPMTMPAVSAALASATVRAAVRLAAGEAIAAGSVPASALALAEAGGRAMDVTRLIRIAITVSAVGVAASAAGFAGWKGFGPANPSGIAESRPDDPSLRGDLAKLQGTWTSTRVEGDPGLGDSVFVWEIKGRALTVTRTEAGREMGRSTVELKLHEADRPRWLELTRGTAPDGTPSPDQGVIYDLDGDTLKVCGGMVGGPRPKEFKPGEGGVYRVLLVFRRGAEKDGAGASPKAGSEKEHGGSEALPELKGDLARLQGEWAVVSGAPKGTSMLVEIRENVFTMTRTGPGGSLHRHAGETIRLDETARPRIMDFAAPDPTGRDTPGIYDLDGDTLKLAVGDPGGPRPTEFRPGEGEKAPHVLILKRRKPAASSPGARGLS